MTLMLILAFEITRKKWNQYTLMMLVLFLIIANITKAIDVKSFIIYLLLIEFYCILRCHFANKFYPSRREGGPLQIFRLNKFQNLLGMKERISAIPKKGSIKSWIQYKNAFINKLRIVNEDICVFFIFCFKWML